jgi:hypothetical protein
MASLIQTESNQETVKQPRFVFVVNLLKEPASPDCERFGRVMRDNTNGKEYFVKDCYAGMDNIRHYTIICVKEIVGRPTDITQFNEADFRGAVKLRDAPLNIQDEIMYFFKYECMKRRTGTFNDFQDPAVQNSGGVGPTNTTSTEGLKLELS